MSQRQDERSHAPGHPQAVADAVAPALADLGLELFDVELTGSGRARTLRVFVDRPAGDDAAVDLDAITAATEALSPVLDHDPRVAAALPGPYTLEVSSPGLERPLRTPAHFRRAVGSTVSVKTRAPGGGPVRRRAVLVAADDAGVTVEVDGTTEHLAYDDILQARTVFEWGPAPKPGRARGRQQAVARS
ncbi:MAG TPA: ribosome maturation factor RimP [Acidimicrobiia bacterium]|nr:ribosome maturation factor RimP [Acidimicrobiia bacterium]